MSWNKNGDLYCNCCHKIVIPKNKVTKKDVKENIGKTFCEECRERFDKVIEKFVNEYYKNKRRSYVT